MADREQPEVHKEPLFVSLDPTTIALRRARLFALLNAEVASSKIDPATAFRRADEFDYLQPIQFIGPWYINPFWRKAEDAPRHRY